MSVKMVVVVLLELLPDVLHDVVKSQRDAFLASLAVAGLLSCLLRLVLCYWHWNLPQHGSTAPWGDRASKRYGPLIDSPVVSDGAFRRTQR